MVIMIRSFLAAREFSVLPVSIYRRLVVTWPFAATRTEAASAMACFSFNVNSGGGQRRGLKGAEAVQGARLSSVTLGGQGRDVEGAKEALGRAQAVCFDVDSTVIAEEGIDVLAEFCGAAKAVADLTARAMGGSMPFQDALKARLDLMRPSKKTVELCLEKHPPRLSPGVSELVSHLHGRGVAVYLVSGGFRAMIEPVADRLSIPRGNIFANTLLFDADTGEYRGFDPDEPTSKDGGKPMVVGMLMKKFDYGSVVMIGDGATDMQAKPPAEAFIGYGGVSVRDAVREGADWFVTDFAPLIEVTRGATTDAGQGGATTNTGGIKHRQLH